MKLLELRLDAFGPFTDKVIDLSGGTHGLHVVYGPNEAGKSSALRGVHNLLFGIPGQTEDSHLHSYDLLRIGGLIQNSKGETIEIVRRKGNKGTLMSPDGGRLDDQVLSPFVGGITGDYFRIFWGINHERLVQGGEDILKGQGDLGEALFSAGSGVSEIRAIRAELDQEASSLFARRASKPHINGSIRRLKEIRSEIRDTTVSAEKWVERNKLLEQASEQLEACTRQVEEVTQEKARLTRLKRTLPLIAEHRQIQLTLANLLNVTVLADDFSTRREEAEKGLKEALRTFEDAQREYDQTQQKLIDLGPTSALLNESDHVNDLFKRVGVQRQALIDRPGLLAKAQEQNLIADALLSQFRTDISASGAGTLRPFMGRKNRLRTLAAERERFNQRFESAEAAFSAAKELVESLKQRAKLLPQARDVDQLEAAIDESRRRGDLESTRENIEQIVAAETARRDSEIKRLGLKQPDGSSLREYRIPEDLFTTQIEQETQTVKERASTEAADLSRITKRTRDIDLRVSDLRTRGDVPTVDILDSIRAKRDAAFDLLRRHWELGVDTKTEAEALLGIGDLTAQYIGTVAEADHTADRLRLESEHVAELGQLLNERQKLEKDLSDLEVGRKWCEEKSALLSVQWNEAWQEVTFSPPTVEGSLRWKSDFERLLERSDKLDESVLQLQSIKDSMETHKKSLFQSMVDHDQAPLADAGFAAILAAAERLFHNLQDEQRIVAEHERLNGQAVDDLRKATDLVSEVKTAIAVWREKWVEATDGLLMESDPDTDDVLGALDTLDAVFKALDNATSFGARVAEIDSFSKVFRSDIQRFAARMDQQSVPEPGEEDGWIERVHANVALVMQEEERRRSALERLEELDGSIKGSTAIIDRTTATIEELRREAGCDSTEDLTAVERLSSQRQRTEVELSRVERDLVRSGDGASLEELAAEASDADSDAIEGKLSSLEQELISSVPNITKAHHARASALAELEFLQGPSLASEKAEEAQAAIALIRDHVSRYAVLRAASAILTLQTDRYQQENQTPLLRSASEIFQQITSGSFVRLEADIDDADRPVLIGIRSKGSRVLTNNMSDGTRDQLFLALRLAAVESACVSAEPMPFIVDDILIQFDDDRSKATLEALAQLAVTTQVVLFTHHGQIQRTARDLISNDVFVHEL